MKNSKSAKLRGTRPAWKTISFTPKGNPDVKRKITFQVGAQNSGDDLDIAAAPLPSVLPTKVPPGKGLKKLVRVVMEPYVHIACKRKIVTTFDPPLQVTIEFTAADSKGIERDAKGNPKLSIVTFYQDGDKWKFARLPSTVKRTDTGDTGTVTAKLSNLRPDDPIGLGFP